MLYLSKEFAKELTDSINSSTQSIVVCSAYIKSKALLSLLASVKSDVKLKVVTRWCKGDLIFGASDLEVYEICAEKGWAFGIDLNLHGKLFLIDDANVFLGSANLTQKGLHIGLAGNHEFGTRIPAGQADIKKINDFIDAEVTWMNDSLYDLIKSEVQKSKNKESLEMSTSWSKVIDAALNKPIEFLWVQELVFSTPSKLLRLNLDEAREAHDFDLLGLNLDDISEESLKRSFKRTRLYGWLRSLVAHESLSFGGVTARLHDAILDDPKPYRVDIKNYNQILFEWAEFVDDTFEISQPNYSQVLSLKSE